MTQTALFAKAKSSLGGRITVNEVFYIGNKQQDGQQAELPVSRLGEMVAQESAFPM